MKRSRTLTLTLMTATSVTLTACGDDLPPPTDMTSFSTVAECTAAGYFPEGCEDAFQAAQEAYLAEAPRFDDQPACETEFGNGSCQEVRPADGGSGFWTGALTGFLVSRALGGIVDAAGYSSYRNRYGDFYGGRRYGYYSTPPSRSGASGGANSYNVSSTSGRDFTVSPGSRPTPNVRSTTASRDGFGGRSSSRSRSSSS